jgi:acyl-CoA dehydrogenase
VHRQSVARRALKRYQPTQVPTEHVPTRREAARRKFADVLVGVTDND